MVFLSIEVLYKGSGRMIKLDEWKFTEWLTPYSGRLFCIFMVFFSYTGHCAIKWLYDAVYDIVATLFLLPQKFLSLWWLFILYAYKSAYVCRLCISPLQGNAIGVLTFMLLLVPLIQPGIVLAM